MPRSNSKSAAAAAEAVEDTAAEQLEGQQDVLDHVDVDSSNYDGETYDPTAPQTVTIRDEAGGTYIGEDEGEGEPEPSESDAEAFRAKVQGTEFEGLTEVKVRQRLYNRAQTQIIEENRDDFNKLAEKLLGEYGLPFRRKRTAREKAADQIKAILAEHPELKPEFPGLALEAKNEATPDDVTIA